MTPFRSGPAHRRPGRVAVATVAALLCAAGCTGQSGDTGGSSGKTLIIGLTATALPSSDTVLAFSQGFEGERFTNFQLYDGLTRYGLKQSTKVPPIVPGLATSWKTSADGRTWTFTLRKGVKFSDGTAFDADAMVFAYDRILNKRSRYYYPAAAGGAALWASSIASYKKVDADHFSVTTTKPNGHLLTDLTFLTVPSPTAVKKYGNKNFADHASGTGPFTFKSQTPGQQLTMVANKKYWGGAPKVDKVILRPLPDASARIAALRSGQVNWIEYPNPDDVQSLKSAGYRILSNDYDHLWYCTFNQRFKPFADVRVRQALNFAIDRKAVADNLLAGTAIPAYQHAPKATLQYDASNDRYSYDPARAKQLLRQAGYPNGFNATLAVPTAGSGNLIPVPIATTLQTQLAKVGVKFAIKTAEWSTYLADLNAGKATADSDMECASTVTYQAESLVRAFWVKGTPVYTGGYYSPQVDQLSTRAEQTIDQSKRVALYRRAESVISADAPYLFVVSDRQPRAVAKNVTGVIAPKSWFIDLTTVRVG